MLTSRLPLRDTSSFASQSAFLVASAAHTACWQTTCYSPTPAPIRLGDKSKRLDACQSSERTRGRHCHELQGDLRQTNSERMLNKGLDTLHLMGIQQWRTPDHNSYFQRKYVLLPLFTALTELGEGGGGRRRDSPNCKQGGPQGIAKVLHMFVRVTPSGIGWVCRVRTRQCVHGAGCVRAHARGVLELKIQSGRKPSPERPAAPSVQSVGLPGMGVTRA